MIKKSVIIPLIVLLAAAGLLFGIAGHLTGCQGSRPDQETDDAYLRADMTPLSTRISGTVRKVNVNDYQSVKAGQILIELDDDDYRATLNQPKLPWPHPKPRSRTIRRRREYRMLKSIQPRRGSSRQRPLSTLPKPASPRPHPNLIAL